MAFKTVYAPALLAIGTLLAAPARAGEAAAIDGGVETQPAAASVPEYGREDIATARWLSYGTTGFGLALTTGLAVVGGATRLPWLLLTGVLAADVVLTVGPSLGHYYLGSSSRTGTALWVRLVLLSTGTVLAAIGVPRGRDAGWFFAAGGVLVAGAFGLAIYDFVALESAARKKGAIEVAPTAWVGPNNAGLAAMGAF
ncbi:MAG: hypothetical protein M0R80_22705 [Proteobacteria bacterium]|jgi:hypothetical protein|nr:hypothetical protein [Pseudomonadota bacterium]